MSSTMADWTLSCAFVLHGCLHSQTAQNVLFLHSAFAFVFSRLLARPNCSKRVVFGTLSAAFVFHGYLHSQTTQNVLFLNTTLSFCPLQSHFYKPDFICYTHLQWCAVDAEIKVHSLLRTQNFQVSPFKAWSILGYSHAYLSCCQGFLLF